MRTFHQHVRPQRRYRRSGFGGAIIPPPTGEASIPLDSNYWLFSTGDVEVPGGAVLPPGSQTAVTVPVVTAPVAITPQMMLMIGGIGLAAFFLMGKHK